MLLPLQFICLDNACPLFFLVGCQAYLAIDINYLIYYFWQLFFFMCFVNVLQCFNPYLQAAYQALWRKRRGRGDDYSYQTSVMEVIWRHIFLALQVLSHDLCLK